MPESSRRQLEFIARLTYTLPGLSGKLRLYFSQFLHFHFSQTLSRDLIQNTENKKASKGFASDEEIKEFTSSLSISELSWCIGAVSLFKKLASDDGDKVVTERLGRLVEKLVALFQLDATVVETSRRLIEKEIEEFRNRQLIRIPVSIWPMVLDFALRCIVITLIRPAPNILAVFNILVIPAIIFSIVVVVHRRDRKYNRQLLDQYGESHRFKIEPNVSIANYSWLALFIGLGVYIAYLLTVPLHGLAFLGLTVYYFISLRFFYVGRLTENGLASQLIESRHEKADYDYDSNDEEIVRLETRLNASTGRLEAYVLESALFGALTFSGFLQIMASDLVSFADLENFANSMFEISRAVIYFDWSAYNASLAKITDKVSLLCLVSVESLLCSIFFLAVIASRLRFSDVADSVRAAINMAKTFNDKEEIMAGAPHLDNERLGKLTAKINQQLHIANEALDRANPIMTYMQYFRSAGILMFLVILVTSSLFITGVLGWIFIALVFATFLYFNFARISVSARAAYLFLRIRLVRNGKLVAAAVSIPFFLVTVVKATFLWPYTDVVTALAFAIGGLYVFTWLAVVAHVDEEFGDIEHRVGTWQRVKTILAIICLGFCLSLAMKQLSLSGADEMIIIFVTALALVMYFVGYFLTRIRWLGIVCGCVLAMSVVGVLFKILHLDGANEMLTIGAIALLIWIPIIIWKRKVFHSLFIRFVITTGLVILLMVSGIVQKGEYMICHGTLDVSQVERVMKANWYEKLVDGDIAESMRMSDWYIETYNARPGYVILYRELTRVYDYSCEDILRNSPNDTLQLQRVIAIAQQIRKITNLFPGFDDRRTANGYRHEALALYQMGKRKEAISVINDALNENFSQTTKDELSVVKDFIDGDL